MKFGEYLEEHLVSEWRSQYLDYYKGKSKLKKLHAFLETSHGYQHILHDSNAYGKSNLFLDLENIGDVNYDSHSAVDVTKSKWMEYQPKYTIDNLNLPNISSPGPLYTHDDSNGLGEEIEEDDNSNDDGEDDDDGDDDDVEDFKVLSLVGKLNDSPSPVTEVYSSGSISYETRPLLPKRHRSHSTSVLYIKNPESHYLSCEDNIVNLAREQFLNWVDLELEKVNAFFKYKEHESCKRFVLIVDQVEKLKQASQEWNDNISDISNHKRSCFQELGSKLSMSTMLMLERANFIFNYFEMPKLPKFFWRSKSIEVKETVEYKSNPPPLFIAKIMIKKAICEIYHKIELLESYRSLNHLAFRKLIKKYDKQCEDSTLSAYMDKVSRSHFCMSKSLDLIQQHIEDLYTETFENGHRKAAVIKLKTVETKSYYIQNFFSGYFIGVCIPLICLFVYSNRIHYKDDYIIHFWASVFLLLFAGFLFAVNCAVWDVYKINYKLVFELNPHDALDYREYLILPSILSLIASCFAYFGDTANNPNLFANTYFYASLFFLLCPLNIFYLKARIWVIVSILRLLLSGFYPVEFRDFFFGVMTCSLTYPIANIPQYFHPSLSSLVYLTCFPPLWRSMQCLRRFLDTGDWFPHFANLAKYLITTFYFFMVPTYRAHNHLKPLFITIALINSSYSVFWDVCMDWSLFQDSENMFLRDVLIYKKKWIYYTAILIDALLRFQWLIYLVEIEQKTIFVVAVIELLRRFLWMFFRMENEHASNMNLLRVSRVCELPYSYTIKDVVQSPKVLKADIGISVCRLFDVNDSIHDQESIISIDTVYSTTTASTGWQHLSRFISRAHAKEFQQRKTSQEGEQ